MRPTSFKRHRFPPEIIRHAIWLYARFTLSFRDVEELLAERGIDASYETVRRWFLKFGPSIAANIRRSRPRSSDHWHLDEMVISIRGGKYWLWRAVDNEGEVLDFLVQRRRDAQTANAPAGIRLVHDTGTVVIPCLKAPPRVLIGDPLETKHGASASQASSPARVKAKGGRPAEYDWHGFIIEIIRIADLDSLPERQSGLMSRMLDWCNQTWGKEPAREFGEIIPTMRDTLLG